MNLGILRVFSILAFFCTFLNAQVDPKLQACKTDVLDVYFGSASQGAKPEIITLIDNSGSMEALSWDDRYFANVTASLHQDPAGGGEGGTDYMYVWKSGSGSTVDIRVYFPFSGSPNYWIEGRMVKPDGNPVVYADVGSDDVNLWLQRSSHFRFAITSKASGSYVFNGTTYTIPSYYNVNFKPKPLSSTGDYASSSAGNILTSDQVRVVDIPVPWAVFDRVATYEQRTLSPDPTGMNTARANKHPQHTYFYDPVPDRATGLATSTAQYYEVDTYWFVSTGQGGLNGNLVSGTWDNIGFIRYHYDYLWWAFFGQDVRNASEGGAYQAGMIDRYSGSHAGGYTVADVREGGAGFVNDGNGLPCMTRIQAIKSALIQTYIAEQLNVWWGIRFLSGCGSGGYTENGQAGPTKCFSSANLTGSPGDRMLLRLYRPSTANSPDGNMQYIQKMGAPNWTPLTYALLNTYAQMASTDNGTNGSVFKSDNDPYKGDSPIPSCRRSFVIVLSDGNPNDTLNCNNDGSGKAIGTNDPFSGGAFPTINMNTIAPGKSNFNIYSLAGVASHITPSAGDSASKTGWPTDNDNANVLPPFRVSTRPSGVTRQIDTMTIGVSMVGKRTDTSGAKMNMYKTALYGWKDRGSFNASSLPLPYDPSASGRNDKTVNPFFFDAQSPSAIADALTLAFSLGKQVTNTMSAPVAPLVGLDVGNQIYLGTFSTQTTGNAVWAGDLLMTGLKNVNGTWVVIHANGSVATTVDQDSAVWSAFKMLKTKGWKNRNILTLKPESVSGALTGKYTTTLLAFNESTSTSDLPNSVLGVSTAANRLSLIRFMLGASDEAQADPAAITSITTNRDSNMMGDIINSTPAIVEFPLSMVPSGSTLATFVSNNPSLTLRFRLIIVGDNQGILHGFGEVSGVDTSTGLIVGVVDELWGIIPPDLLGGLQTWRTGSKHLYMVDGSPSVYLYENATTANGLADGSDVLRVMVGLGKGGRSYYCLTLNGLDPSQPKVSWMVRPEDSSDATVHTMGFSSGQPVVARVFDGGVLKDAFFVSGGLSTTEVDSAFAAVAAYGSGTKLGRSILAFNTYNGSLIKKWDFVNDSTLKTLAPNMGGIPAEVVPVEALPGSNKTQRVYFTDTSGGAYALGTKASSGSRADSSEISSWSMRWIYKPAYSGTVVSTAPAVFPLSYGYPVLRSTAPTSIVQTFGVTLVAGDRNDPMDNDSINPGGGGTTYRNRLITILDRQDSADIATSATGGGSLDAKGSSDSDLMDLTTVNSTSDPKVDPSNSSYYPITKNGYFLNFNLGVAKSGSTTSWFYQKSVTSPMVLNNALFFTTFMPNVTSDICSGSGASYTYRMCQVLNPVYNSGSTQASTSDLSVCNGWIYRYNDIPSRLGNVGLSGVVQAGEVYNTDPSATGAQGQVSTNIGNLPTSPGIPRPRAWRIIR